MFFLNVGASAAPKFIAERWVVNKTAEIVSELLCVMEDHPAPRLAS